MLLKIAAIAVPIAFIAHSYFASDKYPAQLATLKKSFQAYTKKPYRAVIYGGTGAVGSALVAELLASPACTEVIAVGRRSVLDNFSPTSTSNSAGGVPQELINSKKLKQILLPNFEKEVYEKQQQLQNETKGADVVFVCLATTRKQAGTAQRFVQLDKDLAVQSAKVSKAAEIPNCAVITAVGADANSYFLYTKTKGETEREFKDLKFNRLAIVRPAMLITERPTAGFLEKMFTYFSPTMDLFFGGTNYESSLVQTVARGMRKDFEQSFEKQEATTTKVAPAVIDLDCAVYQRQVKEDFAKQKKV